VWPKSGELACQREGKGGGGAGGCRGLPFWWVFVGRGWLGRGTMEALQ
jgi:hypothetical protein